MARFTLELGSVDLDTADIWPDGDAPENPTAQDVADLIDKCGGVRWVASDWNLLTDITIFGPGGPAAAS